MGWVCDSNGWKLISLITPPLFFTKVNGCLSHIKAGCGTNKNEVRITSSYKPTLCKQKSNRTPCYSFASSIAVSAQLLTKKPPIPLAFLKHKQTVKKVHHGTSWLGSSVDIRDVMFSQSSALYDSDNVELSAES